MNKPTQQKPVNPGDLEVLTEYMGRMTPQEVASFIDTILKESGLPRNLVT